MFALHASSPALGFRPAALLAIRLVLVCWLLAGSSFADQAVTVRFTEVRTRGPNTDRSQYALVQIADQQSPPIDLPTSCDGLGTCSSRRVAAETCLPGVATDPEVTPILEEASFTAFVQEGGLTCNYQEPTVLGEITHWHRFALGADTQVDYIPIGIALEQEMASSCRFQEGSILNNNNASGFLYEVEVDTSPRTDTDGDGWWDTWEQFGADADCDGSVDINVHLPQSQGGLHDVPTDPLKPDIFVEVDWMDCNLAEPGSQNSCDPIVDQTGNFDTRTFEPADVVLSSVEAVFDAHGYNLHLVKGEGMPVSGRFVLAAGAMPTTSTATYSLLLADDPTTPEDDGESAALMKPRYLSNFGFATDSFKQTDFKKTSSATCSGVTLPTPMRRVERSALAS